MTVNCYNNMCCGYCEYKAKQTNETAQYKSREKLTTRADPRSRHSTTVLPRWKPSRKSLHGGIKISDHSIHAMSEQCVRNTSGIDYDEVSPPSPYSSKTRLFAGRSPSKTSLKQQKSEAVFNEPTSQVKSSDISQSSYAMMSTSSPSTRSPAEKSSSQLSVSCDNVISRANAIKSASKSNEYTKSIKSSKKSSTKKSSTRSMPCSTEFPCPTCLRSRSLVYQKPAHKKPENSRKQATSNHEKKQRKRPITRIEHASSCCCMVCEDKRNVLEKSLMPRDSERELHKVSQSDSKKQSFECHEHLKKTSGSATGDKKVERTDSCQNYHNGFAFPDIFQNSSDGDQCPRYLMRFCVLVTFIKILSYCLTEGREDIEF